MTIENLKSLWSNAENHLFLYLSIYTSPKIVLFLSWIAWIPSIECQFLYLYSIVFLSLRHWKPIKRPASLPRASSQFFPFVNRLNPIYLHSYPRIEPFSYVRTYVSRYLCHEERPGRVGQDGSDVNRPAA